MRNILEKLNKILTLRQKKKLLFLQGLIIAMSFLEVIGVTAIASFMGVIASPSSLDDNPIAGYLLHVSGASAPSDFLLVMGSSVLFLLFIIMLVSTYTTWKLSMFGANLGAEISSNLYARYMTRSWLFHAENSCALLTKQIANETQRITTGVIQPILRLNAKLVLAIFMSITVLLYNPIVAAIGMCIFSIAYILIYRLVRTKLYLNGRKLSEIATVRFRLINEGFGGIKDLLLLGRQDSYVKEFKNANLIFAHCQGANAALAQTPRFLIEFIAFGALIALIIYLIIDSRGDLEKMLPLLSVYALAGFKLLPALQVIYSSFSQIRGNTSAFEVIYHDLKVNKYDLQKIETSNQNKLLKNSIKINNVSFQYPGKAEKALKDLSLSIKANEVVGIVGHSGSGKSTIVDLILGLIQPTQGEVQIDGATLDARNLRQWQNSIGFVAQDIFLSEGTIAENIAFGVPAEKIDFSRIKMAIKQAHLETTVASLSEKELTTVGERGVQLSGGQRQRLGIARALYHNASVLVFDEATSALDGLTEQHIMQAINVFKGNKTIIMIAHRIKTVKKCDKIFVLKDGELDGSGTYEQLVNNNELFNKMSKLS